MNNLTVKSASDTGRLASNMKLDCRHPFPSACFDHFRSFWEGCGPLPHTWPNGMSTTTKAVLIFSQAVRGHQLL